MDGEDDDDDNDDEGRRSRCSSDESDGGIVVDGPNDEIPKPNSKRKTKK